MNNKIVLISFIAFLSLVFIFSGISAKPSGATPDPVENSTYPVDDEPGSHDAIAGNVTEVDFDAIFSSQTWQGYFGNVSGKIVLGNANNQTMYNWTLTNPTGQVYASTNSTLLWQNLTCFNLTTDGPDLESAFNIPENAADGVNETFNRTDHASFTANNYTLETCPSVKLYNNEGTPTYDVVLIKDVVNNTIFTSIIRHETLGFDGDGHNFQMIVLEDGRDNTDTTPYYFYLEIS